MNAAGSLAGLGVLVTRPVHQAQGLCRLIEQQGARAFPFPVLEILPPSEPAALQAAAQRLEDYNWAIFISANAIEQALPVILAARDWPGSTQIAVIGQSSAQALERHGLQADLCPSHQFDSEGLLALPRLQQVGGSRIVIFRGNGGRGKLAQTLRERGAQVDYVEAYRRARPEADFTPILAPWRAGAIDIAVVNSAESLHNLVAMVGRQGGALLRRTPLLVVSERLVAQAQTLGFERPPVVAASATDAAVLEALLAWQKARH